MRVYLLAYTESAEKIVASAAKLCYANSEVSKLLDGLTDEKAVAFVDMLSEIGHESPIEHASFTFAIEGVSRSLLAQITRHRIASFSVQSQRYVNLEDFSYVVPPSISEDKEALEIFENAMKDDARQYIKITEILKNKYEKQNIEEGIEPKQAVKLAEKKAIEDARFVLPNACETKMVVTMNARTLQNFFRQRCCNRAQWEIKALADEMLRLCFDVAPTLFKNSGPTCLHGGCREGKMSCKKINEVRDFYEKLKSGVSK